MQTPSICHFAIIPLELSFSNWEKNPTWLFYFTFFFSVSLLQQIEKKNEKEIEGRENIVE